MTETPAVRIPVAVAAPLLGVSVRALQRSLKAGAYDAVRDETDRRAPFLVLLSSLPEDAQKKYEAEQATAIVAASSAVVAAPETTAVVPFAPQIADRTERFEGMWAWYEKRPSSTKRKAEAALAAVIDFAEATAAGVSVETATAAVTRKHEISAVTLWRYRAAVDGIPRGEWLPHLAPRYTSHGKEVEFTGDAYDWILNEYHSQSEPNIKFITDEARKHGKSLGWVIPHTRTVTRRLKSEPSAQVILGRKGPKALEASFPTVERDWSKVPLHEMWESDGCRLDVMAIWPDGSIGRPFVVTWRECRSRKVLACKGYKNPNGALVMVALRDAITACGLKPKKGKIDSGPEYANKPFSGGQSNRYRFKIVPGEPVGVATLMGIDLKWSEPGMPRDKPIEPWHGPLHQRVCKSPEFAGAYCGKDPVYKPEEFDKRKAVPIEAVGKKLAEFIHWFNSEHKHRGSGMHGRTPDAVYQELLPTVDVEEHRPDPAHLRLLLMAVKTLKPDNEGVFTLTHKGFGRHRFYSPEFARLPLHMRHRSYAVWYHPEDPTIPVSVHDGETHICDCAPLDRLDALGDEERAGEWKRAKNAAIKEVKGDLKAIRAQAPVIAPAAAVAFADPRPAPGKTAEPKALLQPTGNPGELVNIQTRATIRRIEREAPEAPREVDWDKLAELKRKQDAKRALG